MMGCGCSTRVAPAQKEKGQATSAQAVGDVTPMTHDVSPNEQHPTPVSPLLEQQPHLLQGMPPLSSTRPELCQKPIPVAKQAWELVVADPTDVSPSAVAHESPSKAAILAEGSADEAVPGVAPSSCGRHTDEADPDAVNGRNGKKGGHTREERTTELVSDPGKSQEKGQATSAQAVGDVAPMTHDVSPNEQHPTPVSPLLEQQRDLLQGMPPLSSTRRELCQKPIPVAKQAWELVVADPTDVSSSAAAHESPSKAAILAEGSADEAVPGVAPSSCGRHTDEADPDAVNGRNGKKGGHTREERTTELVSDPGKSQARIRHSSGQDPLPPIVPSTGGAANLPSIPSDGSTLRPGLDINFRKEPTDMVAAAGTGTGSGLKRSSNKHVEDRPVPEGEPQAIHNSDRAFKEVLVVTPLTPDDTSEGHILSERRPAKDKWPHDHRDLDSPETTARGDSYHNDEDGLLRLDARPALATETSGGLDTAIDSTKLGGRSLSLVDFPGNKPDNDLSAGGGLLSSNDDGTWGAASGAFSLLDAEEEDFMETMLMES